MTPALPGDWRRVVGAELDQPYVRRLWAFLRAERRRAVVYPPARDVFAALRYTPYARVRVVLLGQDPYPGAGQAHGLSFSVPPGVPVPPSLANIFQELRDDLGCRIPNNGCLVPWARQGVLLLNTVLTVRAGEPGAHRGRGWERFTGAIIRAVNAKRHRVVFMLWGRDARRARALIDQTRHVVVEGAHPSPHSARYGFFGSRPFSRVNAALRAAGRGEIDWQIPDL
ncbi:MAG: uracil-DNA glycosylase [Armatimonadota bacterium]|nr:uracil-DNA glycosylase [Armatimonadota bacterium]MDR7487049.1 uracil-DNA glycosylase [Armatimonadota bacterium]MDR7532388.1 uracil-DNA glycosylase [Armatimonadota bacterium]MDR7535315.1 uracil-DNA glycosylase [Armatimonadota bacterium]